MAYKPVSSLTCTATAIRITTKRTTAFQGVLHGPCVGHGLHSSCSWLCFWLLFQKGSDQRWLYQEWENTTPIHANSGKRAGYIKNTKGASRDPRKHRCMVSNGERGCSMTEPRICTLTSSSVGMARLRVAGIDQLDANLMSQ